VGITATQPAAGAFFPRHRTDDHALGAAMAAQKRSLCGHKSDISRCPRSELRPGPLAKISAAIIGSLEQNVRPTLRSIGDSLDLTALPHARAGSIKAYAVTKSTRLEGASDIPTVDEAGLPGFHVSTWLALFAPKGTPKEIVVRLNAAVIAALAEPAMRSRLASLGQEIFPRDQQTPEALATFHKAEIAKWWVLA